MIKNRVEFHIEIVYAIIASGPIFCQVVMIIITGHVIPFRTCGSQMWKGTIPSFIISADIIKIVLIFGRVAERYIIIAVRSNVDLVACMIKYLIDASISWGFFDVFIKGIMDIRFISIPSHIIIQFVEVSIIKVDLNRVVSRRRDLGVWCFVIIRAIKGRPYLGHEPNNFQLVYFT